MSKITELASSTINGADSITIELVEPADMPAIVRITWPSQPTVMAPQAFGDTAAALVKIFSAAHVELARTKARRYQ